MPTLTLARTERFEITSSVTDRTYDISVARPLPLLATGKVAEDCPILFVLDSSLTFGTAVERSTLSAAMGSMQSAVVVGVGYPGVLLASLTARTVDFTPETPAGAHAEMAPIIGSAFGGADAFLAFLIDELAPAIRKRAPEASSSRLALHGFSLAGLFVAHALMRRPEAFEAFSIMSPSLWWNDFAVLRERPHFIERLKATGARPRVLVGVGELEQEEPKAAPPGMDLETISATVRKARMVDAARELADDLSQLAVGEVEFVTFTGEDHSGASTAGTGRGTAFLLRADAIPPV